MNNNKFFSLISLIALMPLNCMESKKQTDESQNMPLSTTNNDPSPLVDSLNNHASPLTNLSTAITNMDTRKVELLLNNNNDKFLQGQKGHEIFNLLQKKQNQINRQLSFPRNLRFVPEETLTFLQDAISYIHQQPTELETLSQQKTTLDYVRHLLTAKLLQEKFSETNITATAKYNYRLKLYEVTYHFENGKKYKMYTNDPLIKKEKKSANLIPDILKRVCCRKRKTKRD